MYISVYLCPVRAEIFNHNVAPKPDSPVQNRTPGNPKLDPLTRVSWTPLWVPPPDPL